jgi:hypothetical protein
MGWKPAVVCQCLHCCLAGMMHVCAQCLPPRSHLDPPWPLAHTGVRTSYVAGAPAASRVTPAAPPPSSTTLPSTPTAMGDFPSLAALDRALDALLVAPPSLSPRDGSGTSGSDRGAHRAAGTAAPAVGSSGRGRNRGLQAGQAATPQPAVVSVHCEVDWERELSAAAAAHQLVVLKVEGVNDLVRQLIGHACPPTARLAACLPACQLASPLYWSSSSPACSSTSNHCTLCTTHSPHPAAAPWRCGNRLVYALPDARTCADGYCPSSRSSCSCRSRCCIPPPAHGRGWRLQQP